MGDLQRHGPVDGWRGGVRYEGDRHRRFTLVHRPVSRERTALASSSPAVIEGRTIFRSTVVHPEVAPRILVDGRNASKIGGRILKGPWAGLPVYTLTLEERATCPSTCHLWRECYGNGIHLARRLEAGPDLERMLGAELAALDDQHVDGFAVRVHMLGDFYSVRYAARWSVWLRWLRGLHVFGFTAWGDSTPIGQMIERMNAQHPARCAIRFSRATPSGQGWEATTIWREPEGPRVVEGQVCPQQLGRTASCGTCGLCWAPTMGAVPIVFLGHGRDIQAGRRGRRGVAAE